MSYPNLLFADDGTTGAISVSSDGSADESNWIFDYTVPLNSIQIDLKIPTMIDTENTTVSVLNDGLRYLRRLSCQYWIGQSATYFDHYQKVAFRLDRQYELLEEPVFSTKFRTPSTRTIPIDSSIWAKAWGGQLDEQLDWLDYALDAEHYTAAEETSKAILQMALSIESLKYQLWEQLANFGLCNSSELKDAINNTSKPQLYFSNSLKNLTGHSLQEADPDNYDLIAIIWTARGLIAHGKEKNVEKAIGQPLDAKFANNLVSSVFDLAKFSAVVLSEVKKKHDLRDS